MDGKTISDLKAFISPTRLLLLKGTPPTVDERVDYLRNNPSIPLNDPTRKEIMDTGLKEYEKGELARKIELLSKERIVQEFLKSSPTVDDRIQFVLDNALTGGQTGEQTFNLMLEGLNETQKNGFIEKLVMQEWNRAQTVQATTSFREHNIYSTAIKFAVNQEYKNDPITADTYAKDTFKCIQDFRVPGSLLKLAKDIANSGDPANLIFTLISGVITDNYNRQWEEAKKDTDPAKSESAKKTYMSVANASQNLKKLNTNSKNDPSDTDHEDLKEYRKAVAALTSRVKAAQINEPSNQQPKTAPPTTPRSAPTTPRSDSETQLPSPRKDRTLRGAMKLSAEDLKKVGIETTHRAESAKPKAATTRTRGPGNKQRPPIPEFEAPSPPTSPRGKATIGMHRQKSEGNIVLSGDNAREFVKTRPRSRSDKPPTYKAPAPPETPPSSPREEAQHATSTDVERLRTQIAQVRAKTRALETRIAETRQNAKELNDFKEKASDVVKLDSEIDTLEIRQEAVKSLLAEKKAKIAEHREKLAQEKSSDIPSERKEKMPPQAKEMMKNSTVQKEKAAEAAKATRATDAPEIEKEKSGHTPRGNTPSD